jgi:hypothetical protein
MCRLGVAAFIGGLSGQDVGSLGDRSWRPALDGFGDASGTAALVQDTCKHCGRPFPIVKRTLESCAFNLPDAAIYHGLRLRAPCVALGFVVPGKTTASRRPALQLRRRWQGLMWHIYQVAFLDVEDGAIGEFCPDQAWAVGSQSAQELQRISADIEVCLREARRARTIPAYNSNGIGDSRATEALLESILSPLLHQKHGYEFAGMDRGAPIIEVFWWGHYLDLLYRRPGGATLAIEVKVTEDWEHPLGEPLGCLLQHNAVINIRVSSQEDQLDRTTRQLVQEAETMLANTGRASFLCVR